MALRAGVTSSSVRSGKIVTPPAVRTGAHVTPTVRTRKRPASARSIGLLIWAIAWPTSQSASVSNT